VVTLATQNLLEQVNQTLQSVDLKTHQNVKAIDMELWKSSLMKFMSIRKEVENERLSIG
jgi:hypothetical protein